MIPSIEWWFSCLCDPHPLTPSSAYEGVYMGLRGSGAKLWPSSCFLSRGVLTSPGAQNLPVADLDD